MIVIDDNRALSESLHARIARALGWTERETTSFSLASLRELVRPVDQGLAREIDNEIRSGRYITRNRAGKKSNRAVRRAPDLGRNRLTIFPIKMLAGGREEMGYGQSMLFDPGKFEMLPWEILKEHGIAVIRFDGDASGGWIAVHDYDLADAVKTLRAYASPNGVGVRGNRAGADGDGARRVQAFIDREERGPGVPPSFAGKPFSAIVKKGQVPRAAVAAALRRRLKADVTLWPIDRTLNGESFRAQWYDAEKKIYHEAFVEIWRLYNGNRAVGGRLSPEERASVPSKVEKKLAQPEALQGFSIEPANDTIGMPGSIWVHREPDGAVVVRKLGGGFFVRIDPVSFAGSTGYEAYVWLIGDPPSMGRQNTTRRTVDAAVVWAKYILTRNEREEGTHQRMEAGHDVETAAGMELQIGQVVGFRGTSRRRYVVSVVEHFGSGSTTRTNYSLVALSGGEKGSNPTGVRREQLGLAANQRVIFEGAIARKLQQKYDETRRIH